MKKSLFIATLFFSCITAIHAQLANTKWTGTAYLLMQDKSVKPAVNLK